MRKITKRSAAVIGAAVIAIGGGAAAWAAGGWSVSGSGTGDASAASINLLSAPSPMGPLPVSPGLVTTVTTKVNNPNDFPVLLNSNNVSPTDVVVTGGTSPANASACDASLTGAPTTLVAHFTGTPRIPGKATDYGVSSNVTVADTLPQTCAGTHIQVTYSFTGVSTV